MLFQVEPTSERTVSLFEVHPIREGIHHVSSAETMILMIKLKIHIPLFVTCSTRDFQSFDHCLGKLVMAQLWLLWKHFIIL